MILSSSSVRSMLPSTDCLKRLPVTNSSFGIVAMLSAEGFMRRVKSLIEPVTGMCIVLTYLVDPRLSVIWTLDPGKVASFLSSYTLVSGTDGYTKLMRCSLKVESC